MRRGSMGLKSARRCAAREPPELLEMLDTVDRCFSTVPRIALVAAALTLAIAPAAAQQDFYAGKQITLIVGAGVGGGYDLQARTAARHLGKHIPGNPTVVVQNMPAAGSIAATNFMFSSAPKDGTTDRADPARHAALQADLSRRHALRDRKIRLGRQPEQRDRGHAGLERDIAAPHRQGSVRAGADRRRHRQRRSRDHAAALQFPDRHQVQDRVRLQQHRADRARDRARRGAGHRRLVMVELQGGAPGLDPRQEGHAAHAGRVAERSGACRDCRTRSTSSRRRPTAR